MFDTELKLLKQTNTMESNEVTQNVRVQCTACRTSKSTPVSHRNQNAKSLNGGNAIPGTLRSKYFICFVQVSCGQCEVYLLTHPHIVHLLMDYNVLLHTI